MLYDKSNLPAPPEFPTSNASYNSIVGKMHKAALCASTAAAAIAAVQSIAAHVKGVNTYSKKTRRYGDELVAAIKGEPVAEKPAKANTVKVETAAGEIEVDLSKIAIDPSGHPGGIKTEVEQAAADGDPVAGFMLKGAKAAGAAKAAIALADTGKTFANKSNAKRSLKSAGCDHLPVEWLPAADGYVRPVLIVADDNGLTYAIERGFSAKVAA